MKSSAVLSLLGLCAATLVGVVLAFAVLRAGHGWTAVVLLPPAVLVGGLPPSLAGGPISAVDQELRDLGYAPAGALVREGFAVPTLVYFHQALPVGVLVAAVPAKTTRCEIQMESFFQDGGRLTTTTYPAFALFTTIGDTGVPRLVQLRRGGRPMALDGQHLGTLKAWMAGGREPTPVSREALLACLTEDRSRLRESTERAGWLPPGAWFRWVIRRVPGILRF